MEARSRDVTSMRCRRGGPEQSSGMNADDALGRIQPHDAGNEMSQHEALRLHALLSEAGDANREEHARR